MSSEDFVSLRPEIGRIIESGRQTETSTGSVRPVFAASLATGMLLWSSFTPLDFAPTAWIALVPLCLLVRLERLPKYSYRALAAGGFVWAVTTLQWMRLGHVTMYGALVALSFYLAFYFPAFVALSRRCVKAGCPQWLAVPICWTALELARAYLLTGFAWYFLAHSQYRWTSLVQMSDLTGAYGVSFLIAMSSAVIAECLPASLLLKLRLADSLSETITSGRRQQTVAVALLILSVAAACLYGSVRAIPADQMNDGPVVAVAQGNFTPELKHDPSKWTRMWMDHTLLSRTAAGLRPDVIVWPETMFPEPDVIVEDGVTDTDLIKKLTMPGQVSNSEYAKEIINRWKSQRGRELLTNISQETGAALLIGLLTEVNRPGNSSRYNSAAFIRPDLGYSGRYDKMHRVIFGEYIPLKDVMPWLAKFTPFGAGFGIDAGTAPQVFEYAGAHFAPIICFEDTVPQVVRKVATAEDSAGNTPDVLINMTNDGWFRGSSELDQHLITATFRCIETRRPMVRAVNAGISAFIDSSGRIRQPEHFFLMQEDSAGVVADFERVDSLIDPATQQRYRQRSAVMCGQVPLDGRETVYATYGDWFPLLCLLFAAIFPFAGSPRRWRAGNGGPGNDGPGNDGERTAAPSVSHAA